MGENLDDSDRNGQVLLHPYASLLNARRELAIESVNLLLEGLRIGDVTAIEIALRSLGAEDKGSYTQIFEMTESLHEALDDFRDSINLPPQSSQTGLVDAADRLEEVIQITFEAANKTLDVSEREGDIFQSQIESISNIRNLFNDSNIPFQQKESALQNALDVWEKQILECQEMNLNVLVAQSFQDLTGQAIKKVIALVKRLEENLGRLTQVFGGGDSPDDESPKGLEPAKKITQDEAEKLLQSSRK